MIWGFAGISGSFLVAAFSVNQLHATVPVYRLTFSQRAPRNARGLIKLAGGARFDCIGSTQEFTCYVAGFASPGDHTCGWTISSQPRQRCLATLVPLGMWRLIGNKLYRGSGGWPHPLSAFYRARSRSAAPITSRYTRSVAMHPIRRGAMPTDRVHRLPQQAQPRAIPPLRPQPAASDAATHPQNARQCSSAAIKETTRDREAHARHNATHRSTHQLLGHSNTARTAGRFYRHPHTNWPHD